MTKAADFNDRSLSLGLARVSEAAAIACTPLIGRGDEKAADQAAVDAMRTQLNKLDIAGVVVIGEGERDEAPMLYIGEEVGTGNGPGVDIALDPLEGGERGVVINTSSAAYEDGQLGQSAYAASKGAIASMCLPAAREFARAGIRVVAIAPGLFRTPMMEGLPEETTAAITANIPFPARLGDPVEFAKMAAHIAENAYLNGTVIRLDGAVRLPPR